MLKVNEYFKDILNTYSMYDTASVNTLAVFPLSAASVGGIVFSGIPPAFGPSLLILKRDRRGKHLFLAALSDIIKSLIMCALCVMRNGLGGVSCGKIS